MITHDISKMIDNLNETDRNTVANFVLFLTDTEEKEKAKTLSAMDEIQNMFREDKGWHSEEEMILDMAEYRKNRMRA